jgi:hypothetical protein
MLRLGEVLASNELQLDPWIAKCFAERRQAGCGGLAQGWWRTCMALLAETLNVSC